MGLVGILYRWRRPVVAGLVMVLLAVSLSLTARLHHHVLALSSLAGTVTAPADAGLSWVGGRVTAVAAGVARIGRLESENARLRQQALALRTTRLELQQALADDSRLEGILHLRQALGSWRTVAADVIARNPDSWFDTVTLDRGSAAGIQPGQVVLVPAGLVGRVISTTPRTATVMLLLDPQSGVGAMDARSQAAGVAMGQGGAAGTLSLQLFSHQPDVRPGDVVVTSGFSQYYPKGLLVGQVTAVATRNYQLTTVATVTPAVNFDRLSTVLVVVSRPPGSEAPADLGGAG
ncbi:Cell shape-determining protein MreC [Candidatus Hydrogenisulfobacillus filiaventi]|uniref:Cell shape-determining protein MreC n=1 Tax=Candidatus Hydrogenisulfobacillus filiaventi TaxID=2707344 RepID=A0A6F8ZJ26_9FIRM|nr:rod shape-determining protein MreC [Bacillota bacterium]CAB1129681.1 Cell shape-determining protein MreC [Candidatus Hydrogenisulfobacillus filiaventi]